MDGTRWEPSGDICPKCKQETENEVETYNGVEYVVAERCKRCGWVINMGGEED